MAHSKPIPSKTPSKANPSRSTPKKRSSSQSSKKAQIKTGNKTKRKPTSKKKVSSSTQTKPGSPALKPKVVSHIATRKKKKSHLRSFLMVLIVVGIGGLGSLGYYRNLTHQQLLKQGLEYLTSQESIDFTQISAKVDERNRADAMTRISNSDNPMSMWSLFKNTILMGDSRVYGFMSYGFLPENQVLAAAGYTINNIPEFEDTIAAQQPRVIYLSYGVNDMGLNIGGNEGENGYQKVYEEHIKSLLEKSPNSKIFVNSIIDPTPEALAKNPNWRKVEDFNRQIKEMCQRNGWTYVDNSTICAGGTAPIYASDGIHFFSTFYEDWAKNMLTAQYQSV